MARPIAHALLSFGLVAIPVEIHFAIMDKSVRFHWLHAKCGSRVRNRFFCPVCQIPVERQDLVRGYEIEIPRSQNHTCDQAGSLVVLMDRLG